MKGNKILYAGIAILILGIGFAVGTYAYYQTTVSGTVTGTVLAWECTANGDTATFQIPLGSLYPGSEGEKSILIKSSMDATYTISFSNFSHFGSGTEHPNLNLYKTRSGSSPNYTYSDKITTSSTITGNVPAGTTGATAVFYYYWPYGTTTETYDNSAPSATVTVRCDQV